MRRSRYRLRIVLSVGLVAVGALNIAQAQARRSEGVDVGTAASVARGVSDVPDRPITVATVRLIARGCRESLYGSGVVLSNGRVLTARHVVEEAVTVEVEDEAGRRYQAASALVDRDGRDAAVLMIPGLKGSATVRSDDPGVGAAIAVVGHPQGGALHVELARVSTFTAKAPLAIDGSRVMIVDRMFAEGMSGGPVLDDQDRVVGIAVGVETHSRVGISVPASDVRDLVAGSGTELRVVC